MPKEIIFVYGLPRSGTTFLTEIILTDPRCSTGGGPSYPYEANYIQNLQKIKDWYGSFRVNLDPWAIELTDTYITSFESRFLNQYTDKIYIEKTHVLPAYELFLSAPKRFIFLQRDAKSHYLSLKAWTKHLMKERSSPVFFNAHPDNPDFADGYYNMRHNFINKLRQLKDKGFQMVEVQYSDLLNPDFPFSEHLNLEVDYQLAFDRSEEYSTRHRIKGLDTLTEYEEIVLSRLE